MTRCFEAARKIQDDNPGIQLYRNRAGNAIGYWSHSLDRVQVLVSETLLGTWEPMPDLLVNGKPLFDPEDWAPITYQEIYP